MRLSWRAGKYATRAARSWHIFRPVTPISWRIIPISSKFDEYGRYFSSIYRWWLNFIIKYRCGLVVDHINIVVVSLWSSCGLINIVVVSLVSYIDDWHQYRCVYVWQNPISPRSACIAWRLAKPHMTLVAELTSVYWSLWVYYIQQAATVHCIVLSL